MTGRSMITFSLDDALGVFPVEAILEIYRVVAFAPIDDAPERVVGHASFRGLPLFGMDVQDVFSIEGHVYDEDASIIICRAGKTHLGILVDRIGDIRRVEEADEIPEEQFPPEIKHRCIAHAYSIHDVAHFEFDLEHLLNEKAHQRLHEYASNIEDTHTRLQP